MDNFASPLLPEIGKFVVTACKGVITFEADTPTVFYRGRRLYFCLPSCLKAFEDDPKTSCLADDIKLTEE